MKKVIIKIVTAVYKGVYHQDLTLSESLIFMGVLYIIVGSVYGVMFNVFPGFFKEHISHLD